MNRMIGRLYGDNLICDFCNEPKDCLGKFLANNETITICEECLQGFIDEFNNGEEEEHTE